MSTPDHRPTQWTGVHLALATARPQLGIVLTAAVLFFLGAGVAWADGLTARATVLMAGALFAGPAACLFGRQICLDAATPGYRSLERTLLRAGVAVPYLLGGYSALYDGVWGLRTVADAFSPGGLAASLTFLALGVALVWQTYELNVIARYIDGGWLVITDADPAEPEVAQIASA